LLVYNSATKRFQTSNILNNVIVNGGSFWWHQPSLLKEVLALQYLLP
jgi:hypothetical protein